MYQTLTNNNNNKIQINMTNLGKSFFQMGKSFFQMGKSFFRPIF